MQQLRPDLWETRADSPFPGLTTHAYLWTGGPSGNVLFYSTMTDADFAEIDRLGGAAHQYLSHRDEAGPMLATIAEHFGAQLHAPDVDRADIGRHARIEVPLASRHVDANGIEVIPTPGHTPGSTCYLVPGAGGARYLFTGDTVLLGADGRWFAGFIAPVSQAEPLAESLRLLATLTPDVVISSAFAGTDGAHTLGKRRWTECVDEALEGLAAARVG
jgi:glyoxylase-like metal-dependent hydrolase (beta-lactamase superfamily II)